MNSFVLTKKPSFGENFLKVKLSFVLYKCLRNISMVPKLVMGAIKAQFRQKIRG